MVSAVVWAWCHNNDLHTVSEEHLGAAIAELSDTAADLINSANLGYLLLRRNSLIFICPSINQTTSY